MKEEFESGNYIIPPYERIKHGILDCRDRLLTTYSKYMKFVNLDQDYPKGESDWFQAIRDLYIEIRSSIRKNKIYSKNYEKSIDIMEKYLKSGDLNYSDAVIVTLDFLNYLYDIGLTKIEIDRLDPYEEFKQSY